MARTRKKIEEDLYTPLESYCVGLHEFYKALRKAGFAADTAMGLIMDKEKGAYPDWLLPAMPDFNPNNPDHTDWEEDDD
jgi:hypothetical protein